MSNVSSVQDNCFGCSACFNICPNSAIKMKENEEGFIYPEINENCTNCGLCRNVCPYLLKKFENKKEPDCFAFVANDEIRINSSSGGAFPVLAKHFVEQNGYVAGAVYNDNAFVQHIISNKTEDIERMKNSKYLQSNIGSCYKETKTILENGNLVLFTGTPCQIAGLKAFLQKDYENLYCVDIICHGVPSPKVFRKYINEKIKDQGEKWLYTNFRDKTNGLWSHLTTTTTTTTTTKDSAQNDVYMKAFLSNLCLRQSCTNCKFQTIPRQGDITIGDFWGIWNFDKNLNDEKGTSVVLNNNEKGHFLIDILKNNAKIFQPVPLKYAIDGNLCLIDSVKSNKDRKLFFELLDKKSLKENVEICLDDKVDYLIVNFWDAIFNYGAMLTAYAMQELIQNCGYIVKHLDVGQRTNENWFKNSFMENFADKFLNITNKLSCNQCKELSKMVKGVILGSDQVLRLDYIDYNLNKYLLNWVDNKTRKIAFAPSFGIDKTQFINNQKHQQIIKHMKKALSSFDYLSSREITGKEIFKDVFNLDSDWILDPVFLIDKDKYNSIISKSNIDNLNKIVSYVLDDNEKYDNLYKYLSEKENAEFVKINDVNYLVEDWLKSIKECKMLVTDSFHGVCFALIFSRPFICIRNKNRGNARFDTLIETFGIENNFVNSVNEIFEKNFNYNINFDFVDKKIKEKKILDLSIISKVLTENYSNNPNAKKNKIINTKYLKSLNKRNSLEKLRLRFNYIRCRLLANVTFGKKRQHYINKKHCLKQQLNEDVFVW